MIHFPYDWICECNLLANKVGLIHSSQFPSDDILFQLNFLPTPSIEKKRPTRRITRLRFNQRQISSRYLSFPVVFTNTTHQFLSRYVRRLVTAVHRIQLRGDNTHFKLEMPVTKTSLLTVIITISLLILDWMVRELSSTS